MAITVDAASLLLKSNDLRGESGTLIEVDVERAGWEYTGLIVIKLASGEAWTHSTGPNEVALVPLGGVCSVAAAGQTWTIGGRKIHSVVSPGRSTSHARVSSRSSPKRPWNWPSPRPAPTETSRRN